MCRSPETTCVFTHLTSQFQFLLLKTVSPALASILHMGLPIFTYVHMHIQTLHPYRKEKSILQLYVTLNIEELIVGQLCEYQGEDLHPVPCTL